MQRLWASLLLTVLAACTLSSGVVVLTHPTEVIPKAPPVTAFNAEEWFARGDYVRLQSFLEDLPRGQRERSTSHQALYGKVLLARGDLDAARKSLLQALEVESRWERRGEIERAIAEQFILANDFGAAARYARDGIRHGQGSSRGFVRFLESLGGVSLYSEVREGETGETAFIFSELELIRLPTRVNEVPTTSVLDTGASYTILTRSLAREAGVREIPGSTAYGRGLHRNEFPVTFGVAENLEFANLRLRNVPVILIPDDSLEFDTSRGLFPVPMLLGLHLLKEFSCEIDYRQRRLLFARVAWRGSKRDPLQNLFFVGGRLFARASVNLSGWYQFLLDTGSEPTMMTAKGLRHANLAASSKFYPKTVHGIGKSRSEWARIKGVAIGIDAFRVKFEDMAVRDDADAREDGIVGSSYLKHFRVRMDFRTMRLTIERNG